MPSRIAFSATGLINNSVVLPWAVHDAGNGSTLLAETGTNILVRACTALLLSPCPCSSSESCAWTHRSLLCRPSQDNVRQCDAPLPGAQMLQEFAAVSAFTGDPSYRALAERPMHVVHAANEQASSYNTAVFRWCCCLPGALLPACYR